MSYNLENFADYVGREKEAIIATLFAGGDTAKFARFMRNVKGSTTVPVISGAATLQKGFCVGSDGETKVDTVTITVCPWTFYESFCQDDLQNKFPHMDLAPGSNNADAPAGWEATILEVKTASINETLELTYWQGTEGAGLYPLFDGFIAIGDASGLMKDGNVSAHTEISKANVKQIVDEMRTVATAKVNRSKEYVTLVGDDTFDKYISKEKEDNLYHYKPEHNEGVYDIGGGKGKLMRVYGLDGTQRMFSGLGSNFIVGSDKEGEEDAIEVWYSKDTDKVNMRSKAKSGVTLANLDQLVEFTVGA